MSEAIYTVIIDDELSFLSSFELLVKTNFPEIVIIGTATKVKTGIELIEKLKPQLVFLDINLPDGMGFDILEGISDRNFEVIFTTSYTKYAVQAFEFSALHYLLKPIKLEKLKESVKRYKEKKGNNNLDVQLKILKESLLQSPQKILLPSMSGNKIINIADILYCEAANAYSYIHLTDNQKEMVSRPLKILAESFEEMDFLRIHAKYLVNTKYIIKYKTGKNPELQMINGTELPISQQKLNEVKDTLSKCIKIST
ncbi:LytTR family DNA-binding domain-containing protein [Candidatus Woesearchaeota archaeon]|nr:LytTR family DNA-binding domain-containing protein [Candidatus Woesearchaeota archaeon]